jgi:hypothetical protein
MMRLTPVLLGALFDQMVVKLTGEAGELCQVARNAVGILKCRRHRRKTAVGPDRWAPSRGISNISATVATYRSGMFRRGLQNILVAVTA